MSKKGFIMYCSRKEHIDKLWEKEKAELLDMIFDYNTEWKTQKPQSISVDIIFGFMKSVFDDNNKKRETRKNINVENWKKWWRPKKSKQVEPPETNTQENPKNPTGLNWNPEKAVNVNVNVNVKENEIIKEDISIDKSIDSEAEQTEIAVFEKKEITLKIDELIKSLKDTCNKLWVSYDKYQERNFGKHILTAKDYWEFCEKIGQSREQFAINIIKASVKINFWKGICSWPMKIYQNYPDVYNQTLLKTKQKKEKNKSNTADLTVYQT